MAKSNIHYFVELEPGNRNYRGYIPSRKYKTRKEFGGAHGGFFRVHGQIFHPHQVKAEPAKKNSLFEIILSVLITWLILKYVPSVNVHLSPARWLLGIALSALFGYLVGKLRMDKQQCDADQFNKS